MKSPILEKKYQITNILEYEPILRDEVWNSLSIPRREFFDKIVFPEDFKFCSGSAKPEHHHYGESGLLVHTLEVVVICKEMSKLYNVDNDVLLLSALFHDWGKMWDYKRVGYKDGKIIWGSSDHKRMIHHISRSAIEFNKLAELHNLEENFSDQVTHSILAHHGKREYGSPVAPKSKESWMLHLADSLSARMNDWNKIDRF